jgi:hypothetical protein
LSLGFEALFGVAVIAAVIGLLALVGGELPTRHSVSLLLVAQVAIATAITVPLVAILLALMLRVVWRLVRPG